MSFCSKPPRGQRDLDEVDDEDREDDGMKTILGTLTQLYQHDGRTTTGGGAAWMLGTSMLAHTGESDEDDQYENNPIMQLVTRTLADMVLHVLTKLM